MEKRRADQLLFEKGLAPSREKARAMILGGEIFARGIRVEKAGTRYDIDTEFTVKPLRARYVSRGGYKLEGAIQAFGLDFKQKSVLDVGASTGGYTDCALQNGASRVYALDVGYGQLDWSLRNDQRVTVFERTNIRYFTLEDLGEPVDMVTMDVSFISTSLIFPVLPALMKEEGQLVSLIKPQFEAGRDKVGKKGVVRDPQIHEEVLLRSIEAASRNGLYCQGVCYSPIRGPEGNIEYFLNLLKQGNTIDDVEALVHNMVLTAHQVLEG